MSAITEMQVAVRPPMAGEVRLSSEEIEIGVRDGVIPITSFAAKFLTEPSRKVLKAAPVRSVR